MAKHYANLMTDMLVLHDVLIDGADGYTSQIDLVLIGYKGVCVVEVKMYDEAKIYGDGKKTKWYYYKRGRKYEIYSPMAQNKKHVKYLREFLKEFDNIPIFSVVTVICDDYKVSNIDEDNTVVCNSLPAMDRAIKRLSDNKPTVFNDFQRKRIYNYIKYNQKDGKTVREEHKQNVISYKESLDKMKDEKNCPYCKKTLVLRNGKYGEFYGCPNYPKCKYTLKSK